MARSHILAVLAEEGRVVDAEAHRHRGLVNRDAGQCLGVGGQGNSVTDLEAFQTDNGADIAAAHALDVLLSHTLKGAQLLNLLLHHLAVFFAQGDFHAVLEGAAVHASHGNTSHVAAVVQRRDEHLGISLEHLRLGDVFDDGIEHSRDVVGGLFPVLAHPSLLGRTEDGGEVELILGGVEVAHQVKDHFLHLVGAAVGLVHLVDDNDGLETQLQCLLQHKTRLGHGALEGVHQQQAAVGHVEHALNFAAKVAVTRGVDDVDFVAVVGNGYVLGQDGDAALTFQVIAVQDLSTHILVVAEQVTCR